MNLASNAKESLLFCVESTQNNHNPHCGLWFGPHKPLPETFFEPFVNEVQSLFTKGFEWIHKESGMKMNSKVIDW